MSFNINAIPSEERSQKHVATHIEMYKRSMDTIRVYNPTDKDYVIYNDKLFAKEEYKVPAKDKDLGYGDGCLDVPRYIADRYIKRMGAKLIQEESLKRWKIERKKYPRAEWGKYEERMALKTSDKEAWKEFATQLFKGVVKRHQMAEPEPMEEKNKRSTFSKAEAAIEDLGLADMTVEEIEQSKDQLAQMVQQ